MKVACIRNYKDVNDSLVNFGERSKEKFKTKALRMWMFNVMKVMSCRPFKTFK